MTEVMHPQGEQMLSNNGMSWSCAVVQQGPPCVPPPPPFEACVLGASQPQCEAPAWVSNIATPKNARPVPSQLSEADLGQTAMAPGVTPKVGGKEDAAVPDAPCWTPTVAAVAVPAPAPDMEVNVTTVGAPSVPCPPMPIPASMNPYPQEQYDPYALCNKDLSMGVGVGPCVMPAPPAPHPITAWYRVSFLGGLALRSGPSVDAARTGAMLYQNETFAVTETLNGLDSRIYLLLADGRGWAFDDSALMPQDPSVVRGRWQAAPVMAEPPVMPFPTMQPYTAPQVWEQPFCQEAFDDEATKKRRRRKRGGVKRNKNKRALEAEIYGAKPLSEAEADTDEPPDASLEADSLHSEVEVEGASN